MEQGLSFAETATEYARDVVEERIPACKWHRLACQRHLKDLERAGSEGFPYVFNPELTDRQGRIYFPAERICTFAQLMPHIKGEWAAQGLRIKLERWQVFVLASIFGWIKSETGKRRFRLADLFVPRKNSKSTLASIIGLYMLTADEEFGAEVYSGATSEKQAMEVFRPALLMANSTARFRERYGVAVSASNIAVLATNSKFEAVIGKPGDGASPSCAIVDEYHEHKTSVLYDTMKTGMMARAQPLLLVITTAGTDIGGPCYQHQIELQKILQGVIVNEQRFGIIFGIDQKEGKKKADDWTTEASLIKANPNYGVSIYRDVILADLQEAIGDARKQNSFKTKNLNMWVASASPWLNLHELQLAGDPSLTIDSEQWDGGVSGLDLASKIDIASKVRVLWKDKPDGRHYYAISRNYVPAAAVAKPENEHYQGWVKDGHLVETPGNMIDLELIQEEALTDAGSGPLSAVGKDQYGGQQLGANLAAEGIEVVDIPMVVKYLSDPMKMIQALLSDGRFHHDDNPCYVWQMSNVECYADRNENIFPRKAREQNKIDAAVATIIAMNRALAPVEEEGEVGMEVW